MSKSFSPSVSVLPRDSSMRTVCFSSSPSPLRFAHFSALSLHAAENPDENSALTSESNSPQCLSVPYFFISSFRGGDLKDISLCIFLQMLFRASSDSLLRFISQRKPFPISADARMISMHNTGFIFYILRFYNLFYFHWLLRKHGYIVKGSCFEKGT